MANKNHFVYHRKTGNLYYVVDKAVDATNATDGRKMVIYRNCAGETFVREAAEFNEKFNYMNVSDKPQKED